MKQVEKQNNVASDVAWNTIGTFVYFFSQWVLTVFVARISGYADAGNFALAISFANIFVYIEYWGVRNYQVSDIQYEFSNGVYAGARIVSTAAALLLVPLMLLIYGYRGELILCCIVAVVFKTLESVTDLYFGTMQRLDRYRQIAVSYCLKGFLPAAAFLAGLLLHLPLPMSMLLMTAAYFAVVLVYDGVILRGSGLFSPEFHSVKKLLIKCMPLMINGLISAYMIYLPRNAVNAMIGPEELGYYSSVSTVVVVLSTLAGSVWAAIMPTISGMVQQRESAKLRGFYRRLLLVICGVSVVTVIAGRLLGPFFFSIVYGKEILDHMELLIPVLLNAVFLMLDAFYDTMFIPMGHRSALLSCNAVGFAVCAATVRFATARFGAVGACCSMTLGLAVRFIVLYILNERHLKELEK